MLTPVSEHDLLLFWTQLVILLGAARLMGVVAQRFKQPAIIGELGAGVLLGPTVLGRLAPGLAGSLFPGGEVESALVLGIAWLGILLLLVVTGFETDVSLLARLGRSSLAVSVGSLVVPIAFGLGLGWLLPSNLRGENATQLGFALFIAVAVSISSLPVVAKILADMNLMRRNIGQVIVASATANDLVGLLFLGTVTGIFTSGSLDLGQLGVTAVAVLVFLALALTLGQRTADIVLRRAHGAGGYRGALTATLFWALALGAITQAIGVEAVLGALVAGIVLGRSKYQRDDVKDTFATLSNAVFAPIFFATAGLYVDLAAILTPAGLIGTGAVLVVAVASKLLGTMAGARFSDLGRTEALAVGVGLNARGAIGVVVATVGLRIGALNEASYAIVIVMAILTSVGAPPLLRPILQRLKAPPEEAERLEREQRLSRSVIANVKSALLPTRGGLNSAVASRVLDAVLQPEASVTVLSVASHGSTDDGNPIERHGILDPLQGRAVERRRAVHDDASAAILDEIRLGYGLVVLGVNDDFAGTHEMSDPIQRIIAGSPAPLLLVRRAPQLTDPDHVHGDTLRRIMVPITGTRPGRAAEELAHLLGERLSAQVEGVHVVTRSDRSRFGTPQGEPAVEQQVQRAQALATSFGRGATIDVRHGPLPYEELLRAAEERESDVLVIGSQARSHDGRPFLGHGVEYMLEHASQTVLAIVFPADEESAD